MPHYKLDNALSVEMLDHIQSRLPPLDIHAAIDFSAAHEDLQCYFDTYGFQLMECVEHADYSLGYLEAANGRVACHCWCPRTVRGTVFVSHGLFDHVGLYLDFIDNLVLQGYMVVAIDFPGHGLSSAHTAEITDFADYATIIDSCLNALERDMPQPVYGLGQSTGCAALLSYLLIGGGDKISRLVLLAPLIQVRKWPWAVVAHTFAKTCVDSVSRSFTVHSHRESFCQFLSEADPLQPRRILVKWVGAMRAWHRSFDRLPQSSIETLLVQGSEDRTVLWEKNLPRIQRKLTNNEVMMVDGAMHHLVNEGDAWREGIITRMLNFFDKS